MSSLTRRGFFLRHTLKTPDAPDAIEKNKNSEVVIGKIADFPVGKKKKLERFHLTIESFPEGLRARSNHSNSQNKFYSIKANQFGELIVNQSEDWPAQLVFSILKLGPDDFDLSQEETDNE